MSPSLGQLPAGPPRPPRSPRTPRRRVAARPIALPITLLVALLAAGCGGDGGGEGGGPGGAASSGGGKAPAGSSGGGKAEPKTIDPATVGSIAGIVRFDGTAPERQTFQPVGEQWCMQHSGGEMPDESLLVEGDRLVNAFVWIKDGLDEYEFEPPAEPVVLDQQGCNYGPRVVGIQTNQELEARNSDPIMHNVHLGKFNYGMPAGSKPRTMKWRKQEVMVHGICDVHSWMRSYVGVVDHPYFAVTGSDGSFTLQGVPPGSYTLEAWHETLGRRSVELTLGEGESASAPALVFEGG